MPCPKRAQLIARLQSHVETLGLPSERICPYSSRKAFLCRGFAQWLWDAREQRRNERTHMLPLSAVELRTLLDSWHEVQRAGLGGNHCRGILVEEYRLPCEGWDEWSDEDLARMCRDFGLAVESRPLADA